MCSYSLLLEQNLQLGELRFPERKECGIRVANGGWHFGYMGGHGERDIKKRVQEKVVSAAHQEYNNREVLSDAADKIKDGKDIFGRDAKFVMRTIDETYPEYIQTHQKELSFLIMQPETDRHKELRHLCRQLRKLYEKILRGFRKIKRFIKKTKE